MRMIGLVVFGVVNVWIIMFLKLFMIWERFVMMNFFIWIGFENEKMMVIGVLVIVWFCVKCSVYLLEICELGFVLFWLL